jgi:tetratricopeptide (TPR) repeat protein
MAPSVTARLYHGLHHIAALSGSARLRNKVERTLARRAALRCEAARLLAQRGDMDGALAKLEEAVTICPWKVGWLAEYARLAARNRRWQTAKEALDRALAQRAHPNWHALRARALVGLGHHAQAAEDYRQAVVLAPTRANWFAALGRALAASGARREAVAALERALELDGTNADWWAALASIRLDLASPGGAVAACDRALDLQVEAGWYALRARSLTALERTAEAIADFRRALDLDPARVAWWGQLARLLAASNRTVEAIEAYRVALALDDRPARIHASLGRLLAERGEIDAAIEHLGRAIELDGDRPDWRADRDALQKQASGRSAGALFAEKDAQWYDTIYEHSEKYQVGYEESVYWRVWQRILEKLAEFGTPAIIEIGCGPGQLATAIRDRVRPRAYLGLDFSGKAIDMARANVPEFAFVVGDALDAAEVERFPYDIVICTEVLEHIERDRDVISRWRPGAAMIATVPSFDSAAHVRHFRNANEVRARYDGLIDDLSVEQIAIERDASLYLVCGRVAEPKHRNGRNVR